MAWWIYGLRGVDKYTLKLDELLVAEDITARQVSDFIWEHSAKRNEAVFFSPVGGSCVQWDSAEEYLKEDCECELYGFPPDNPKASKASPGDEPNPLTLWLEADE